MQHINLYGPSNTLGYGVHFTNILQEMLSRRVSIHTTVIGENQHPEFRTILDNLSNPSIYDPDAPSLFVFHDTFSSQFHGKPRASFCVFETDKPFGPELVSKCEYIFTTTQEHKDILDKLMDPSKVYVVPEGVNSKTFDINKTEKLIDTNKFTFIIGGKVEARKNTDKAIKAFIDALQYKEAALICHTMNPFLRNGFTSVDIQGMGYKLTSDTSTIKVYSNGFSELYFVSRNIPTNDLYKLYNSANVGISVSSGEGWDLVCNEMLAMGLPVIMSNVLGHKQYIYENPYIDNDLIISCPNLEIANDEIFFNGKQGQWYVVDINDIRSKINLAFKNKNNYINKNKDLSKFIIDKFNWKKTVDIIFEILNIKEE